MLDRANKLLILSFFVNIFMKRRTKTTFTWLIIWAIILTSIAGLSFFYFDFSPLILFLATVNLAAFLLFGWDKIAAGQGIDRVPELVLYFSVVCGGGIGALLGMNVFRHKTRKSSFQFVVAAIFLVQLALIAFLISKEVCCQSFVFFKL